MVMLSISTVEIVAEPKASPEKETKEDDKPKTEKTSTSIKEEVKASEPVKIEEKGKAKMPIVKDNPFYAFLIDISKKVQFPDDEMEKAKAIVLTDKGNSMLESISNTYKSGGYDKNLGKIATDLGQLAKQFNGSDVADDKSKNIKTDVAKKETKTADKVEPELHPLMKAITEISDEKTFASVKTKIAKEKAEIVSKKKGFVVTLQEYVNGNVYVMNEADKKKYFSLPARFSIHFDIKK